MWISNFVEKNVGKKSFCGRSPNDKGWSNFWFFCVLEFCLSFGGRNCKIWFCFLNCTVQVIIVHCHHFTGTSIRPYHCLCLHFFFLFLSKVSSLQLIFWQIQWNVGKCLLFILLLGSHVIKSCRLTIFVGFSVTWMEASYMEITAPICLGINCLS